MPCQPTTLARSCDENTAMSRERGPPPRCFKRDVPDLNFEDSVRAIMSLQEAPPGRDDLTGYIPDGEDADLLVAEAVKIFAHNCTAVPGFKELLEGCNLSDDEAKIIIAYKLENPYPLYKWLNGWLLSDRRDKETIGPAFVLLYRALEKLPLICAHAARAARVNNIPALQSTFTDYKTRLAPGMELNFWAFSSFSTDDDVINSDMFMGKDFEEAIVYTCPKLWGVDIDIFRGPTAAPEAEILPLAPAIFRVVGAARLRKKVSVVLVQEDNQEMAYCLPNGPSIGDKQQGSPPVTIDDTLHVVAPEHTVEDWLRKGDDLRSTGRRTSATMVANDGQRLTSKDCYVAALTLDPSAARGWSGACFFTNADETITVKGKAYTRRECALTAIDLAPTDGIGWFALGRTVEKGESIHVNNEVYTRPQLYVESLKHEPQLASAWNNLGCAIQNGASIDVNGQVFTSQQLFMEALKQDPQCTAAWCTLASRMSADGSINVNGQLYNRQQLHVEGLKHDPQHCAAWYNLGLIVSPGESIGVNGQLYNQQQLFIEGLKHNPKDAPSWYSVGVTRSRNNELVSVNGQAYTVQQLYMESLKYDPKCAAAWGNLARTTLKGETVSVSGRVYTNQQLYFEALKIEPEMATAWAGLGTITSDNQRIDIGGQVYTRRRLYVQALKYNPRLAIVWEDLGACGPDGVIISIHGKMFTRQGLLVEALKHNPKHQKTWRTLGGIMLPDESIWLFNKKYTKEDCLKWNPLMFSK